MNVVVRLALLAYPPSFRREVGAEWARTWRDLRTHGGRGTVGLLVAIVGEVLVTAPRLRWRALGDPAQGILVVAAGTVGLVAVVLGSPAVLLLVAAAVVLAALQGAGSDRPVAATAPRRWGRWLGAAAGAFLVGLAVLAIDGDDDLSSAAWAAWMLSWSAAIVLALIGLGLAAVRLVAPRHWTTTRRSP